MAQRVISVSLSEKLVAKLDQAAEEEFASRSEFIREAVVAAIRRTDTYKVRLAAAAFNTDPPSEEKIYELLRFKKGKLWYKQWTRNMRKP